MANGRSRNPWRWAVVCGQQLAASVCAALDGCRRVTRIGKTPGGPVSVTPSRSAVDRSGGSIWTLGPSADRRIAKIYGAGRERLAPAGRLTLSTKHGITSWRSEECRNLALIYLRAGMQSSSMVT